MYGMIHRAARTMSIDVMGEAGFKALAADAGFDEGDFLSAHVYPDTRTLALVAAIADRTGQTVDGALAAFGRFWISYADKSAYGPVMRMNGDTLAEFLGNLDRMHATIQRVMPETRMPSFDVLASGPARIDVLYRSERTGLEPFVGGLMEGLMQRFGHQGHVSCTPHAEGALFTLHLAGAS
ncbi:MAG: heme NO-binding domain-containing protein [Hyphomonadaceae bacterium]|nr:heme NO-binding domain-containing protein [Hyphomonadaceae bacterium]